MLPRPVFANDAYFLGFLCGMILGGFLIGLLPLLLGLSRGQTGLAWGGFAASAAGGFFGTVFLAVPIAIVFTVIILCQPAANAQPRPRRYDYDDDRPCRFRDDDEDDGDRYRDVRSRWRERDERPPPRYRDDDRDERPPPRRRSYDEDRRAGNSRDPDDY